MKLEHIGVMELISDSDTEILAKLLAAYQASKAGRRPFPGLRQ